MEQPKQGTSSTKTAQRQHESDLVLPDFMSETWSAVDRLGHEFGRGLTYDHAIQLAVAWSEQPCEIRDMATGYMADTRRKRDGEIVVRCDHVALQNYELQMRLKLWRKEPL
jgi:hypothetical protein